MKILLKIKFAVLSRLRIKCHCGHWTKRAVFIDDKNYFLVSNLLSGKRPLYCVACIKQIPFMSCAECGNKIMAGDRYIKKCDGNHKDYFLCANCLDGGMDYLFSTIYDPENLIPKQKKRKTLGQKWSRVLNFYQFK